MTTFDDGFNAGQLRERVAEHDRRLNAINGSIVASTATQQQLAKEIAQLALKVESIGSKVGVYASLGAFAASVVGSIVTGLVVFAATH